MNSMKITRIEARQILDSRGNPTVEADVWLRGGAMGRAAVPSGASTGSHEAHELRDGSQEYQGKGVLTAVANIHEHILPKLIDMPADDQAAIDEAMKRLDGTSDKSNLGANAILAVSLAAAHAAAKAKGILLYSHINDLAGKPEKCLPMPMMNLLNGGQHAGNSTDIQEFMVIPSLAENMPQAIRTGAEVFAALKKLLQERNLPVAVGDEGGFTLPVKHANSEALDVLQEACLRSHYLPGEEIHFSLDVAAAELYRNRKYYLDTENKRLNTSEMIAYLEKLQQDYPIVSLEDGLGEDEWSGWQKLSRVMSGVQLVGDDFLVTNPKRLERAITEQACNAILVKPNQIGTLSETIEVIKRAKDAGWNTIVSHRSGETEDVSIVHIAIGTGAGQIKTGSLSRGERTAKYNELLRISEIDPSLHMNRPF